VKEISRILKEDGWSFTGDCLVLRTTFRKQEKQPLTLITYFVLMLIAYYLARNSTFQVVKVMKPDSYLVIITDILFWLSMTLWLIVWRKDPGFLK
jgi:hypothetical protein